MVRHDVIVALVIFLTACAPTATPEQPTATLIPIVTETAVPTLVPINLSGPAAGTVMTWMDGGSLAYVPAGQFSMGAGGADNPSHSVSLSAYWISRTKITNRMYALCVGVGVCAPPASIPGGPVYSNPVYADHPVVGVNWEQASAYCGWAGGRLPTEAEWEKVARGPGGNTYPWGEEQPSCDLLNYAGCADSTTSVIAYPESASPYLALDMAGNAFEWVADWYDASYYATSPIQDPPGAESGIYRVIRGSGFESDSTQIASAIRRPADPTLHQPRPRLPLCCSATHQLPALLPGQSLPARRSERAHACQSLYCARGATAWPFLQGQVSLQHHPPAAWHHVHRAHRRFRLHQHHRRRHVAGCLHRPGCHQRHVRSLQLDL